MSMKMKAAIFVEPGRIVLDEKPIPDVGPLDALVRMLQKFRVIELVRTGKVVMARGEEIT